MSVCKVHASPLVHEGMPNAIIASQTTSNHRYINVDPQKTFRTRAFIKIIKNVKIGLIKMLVTKLFKLDEKLSRKITMLMCVTTFDNFGSSTENFLIG